MFGYGRKGYPPDTTCNNGSVDYCHLSITLEWGLRGALCTYVCSRQQNV